MDLLIPNDPPVSAPTTVATTVIPVPIEEEPVPLDDVVLLDVYSPNCPDDSETRGEAGVGLLPQPTIMNLLLVSEPVEAPMVENLPPQIEEAAQLETVLLNEEIDEGVLYQLVRMEVQPSEQVD